MKALLYPIALAILSASVEAMSESPPAPPVPEPDSWHDYLQEECEELVEGTFY